MRGDPPNPPKRKYRDASEDTDVTVSANKKGKTVPQRKEQLQKDYPSVNDLKRRIRDVKRLLNKPDLGADARIVQERALAGYEHDLEDEVQRRGRSAMIKKYHFVRFLDRKSATKHLNRLLRRERAHADSANTDPGLQQATHVARVNLNYTIYYPLNEKYVSLYAEVKQQKKEQDDDSGDSKEDKTNKFGVLNVDAEKPAMWYVVERCMADETLGLLREGKLSTGMTTSVDTPEPTTTTSATENRNKKGKEKHKEENKSSVDKLSRTSKSKSRSDNNDRKGRVARHGATTSSTSTSRKDRRHEEKKDGDDESDGGFFEM